MTVSKNANALEQALNVTAHAIPLPADSIGDASKSRALETVTRFKTAKAEGRLRKALPIMKRAVRKINAHEFREAAVLGLEALRVDENIALANHITAIALDKLGLASFALEMYERAQRLDPKEPEVYQNLGLLAWRMELYDVAEQFFRIFARMMPEAIEGPNNLACVLRDKGQMEDAVEVLRAAIYTNQGSSMLWNSLGTVMMEQTDFEKAALFYKQALEITPDLARAYHNLGYCRATEGFHDEALDYIEKALEIGNMPQHELAETRHARAISLIGTGKLDEAWDAYECRNDVTYNKATCFSIPTKKWDGEPLEGKRLLIVGEQGLGDEVMFLNQGHDLIKRLGPDGHLTLAVVPRLVSLMERTFPEATVTKHATIRNNGVPLRGCPTITNWQDFDYWAPMGSILRVLRTSLDAFPKDGGFLKPDPARIDHWRGELSKLGPGFKSGLLWKSMLMSAKRTKYYSPFAQWKSTLNVKNVTWINLQYGDCEADLERAEKEFGVKVHQLDGIDLKNDLDDLAALCVALDLVVGPMNATTNISAGAGAKTAIIAAPNSWPFLGTGQLPWYPTATVFSPKTISDWKPAMSDFNLWLEARIAEHDERRVQGAA